MQLNKRESEKTDVSWSQLVLITIILLMLGLLFFLRYIFPTSTFVIKYFTGTYAGIFYVVIIIFAVVIDTLAVRRRKKSTKKE